MIREWIESNSSHDSGFVGQIKPEDVLYYYEKPILFTAKMGLFEVICYKADELETFDLYIVSQIDAAILSALRAGRLSIKGALASKGNSWMIKLDCEFVSIGTIPIDLEKIPEDYLPEAGLGLYPDTAYVPDLLEQNAAFFSVRFSGGELKKETMSFHSFKSLVDRVYSVARKAFTPAGLKNSKSSTFDFVIREPVFGSLILTIDQPTINSEILEKKNLNIDLVTGEFSKKNISFFNEVKYLTKMANVKEIDIGTADQHLSTLSNLLNLLPTEETEFSKIEFSGSSFGRTHSVVIEEAAGNRLYQAYERASGNQTTLRGSIIIINSKSHTFVVNSDSGREVTCEVDIQYFKQLESDNRFKSRADIEVSGRFYKRSKRDYMYTDNNVTFV